MLSGSRRRQRTRTPDGIRIKAILPGAIDTEMLRGKTEMVRRSEVQVIPDLSLIGRFGRVEEIAQSVLWLSSDRSSYTYGHLLVVDGGYLAR